MEFSNRKGCVGKVMFKVGPWEKTLLYYEIKPLKMNHYSVSSVRRSVMNSKT